MFTLKAANTHRAMTYLTKSMQQIGRTGDGVVTIPEPVSVTILRTGECVPFQPWLDWNPFSGLLEGIWTVAGLDAYMEWLCRFRPDARGEFLYATEEKHFFSPTSVGPYLSNYGNWVAERLRDAATETHNIIQFWGHEELMKRPTVHPVVTQIIPTVDDSELNFLVNVAGLDLFRLPDLMVQLHLYQRLMARTACVLPGTICLVINRLVGGKDFVDSARPDEDDRYDDGLPTLGWPTGVGFQAARAEARMFVTEGSCPGMQWSLLKIAGLMVQAHDALQENNPASVERALKLVSQMPHCDWREACKLWIERGAGTP